MSTEVQEKKTYQLLPGRELRLEVGADSQTTLILEAGEAEIFGAELAPAHKYVLTGLHKVAVFSFRGATVSLSPEPAVVYVAEETTGSLYLNLHVGLEQRRVAEAQGPRVLVAGGVDVGKSTLCRTLLNYAVRASRSPMYVDLDPSEGSVSVPGTLTATAIPDIVGPEEGYSGLTAGADAPTRPLVYHYGAMHAGDNAELYGGIVKRLAQTVESRISKDPLVKTSGMIVDTAGAGDAVGIEMTILAIKELKIDTVIVVGNERLYSTLHSQFKSQTPAVNVLKFHKPGGAVDRDEAFRRAVQKERIRSYFYGPSTVDLAPCHVQITWAKAQIYRLNEASVAPDSALPIGGQRRVVGPRLVRVDTPDILLHTLMAVVQGVPRDSVMLDEHGKPIVAEELDASEILGKPVMGFVCVHEVDLQGKWMTVLAPMDSVPSPRMISSVFRWVEG